VRLCGGGPCVVPATASVDTSVPGESEAHEQEKIIHPHQLQATGTILDFGYPEHLCRTKSK